MKATLQQPIIDHTASANSGASSAAGPWPLTQGQQSLWFIHRLQPQDTAYNTGFAMRINGAMDKTAMLKAIRQVYARHPLLTAVFRNGKEGPECIPTQAAPHFEQIDVSGLPDEAVHQRIMACYQLPFDLENGPVARCYVFSKSPQEHIFLFSVHHIVYDFGCKGLLSKELITYYMEACGYPPEQPLPLPRQFREHALEEQSLLQGRQGEKLRAFWQQQVSRFPVMPELAAYKRYETPAAPDSDLVFFGLDANLYRLLKAQARQQNVTTFAWLLASFQLLLHTYTGSRTVVLGVPVSNREGKDSNTLGYFVNLLPVTGSLDGKLTFLDYLHDSRKTFMQAFAHKQFPFAAITELSRAERDPDKNPLVQVAFNYVREAESMGEDLQSQVSYYGIPQQTAFDVTFDIEEYDQHLYIACTYKTQRYDRSFMEALCRHYCFYLEQTLQQPQLPLDALQAVTPEERALFSQWNNTHQAGEGSEVITAVFSDMADRYPDRLAVTAPDRRLTYRELDEASNRLARFIGQHLLSAKGAVIALMTQRSSWMITGMLGILKAGAAYMPIDGDYPTARIQLMLEDTDCRLLLCDDETLLAQHPLTGKVTCLNLQKIWPELAVLPATPVDVGAEASDVAYVMFTSGSTGKPKGVMVPHAGVVNLVKGNHCMQFSPEDNFMLTANYIFDLCTFEIYGALLNGASLHVLGMDTVFSPSALTAYIREHRINATCLSTALFNRLVDNDPAFVASFDHLLFGGEAASLPHVRKALPYAKKNGLINIYGPTECTTFVLCYAAHGLPEQAGAVPIGRPHTNTKVYILNEALRPVPVGVSGELYVSGKGVSRGYLNRPELNAARFLPAPWDPAEILYATGDYACWLPDGNVYFLGRKDQQVKFRGYRIELGEIEAALCAHEQVKGAVVHCHQEAGNSVLAAFVATGGQQPEQQQLQDFLGRNLPPYMVPARFYFLSEFPLNKSAKVDRNALIAMIGSSTAPLQPYAAPQTGVQQAVAAIWQNVLQQPAVGLHDNFFELGGHSLLATRIMSQITSQFGVELPLSAIFRKPTVSTISEAIEAQQQQSTETAAQPLALMRANREKFRRP